MALHRRQSGPDLIQHQRGSADQISSTLASPLVLILFLPRPHSFFALASRWSIAYALRMCAGRSGVLVSLGGAKSPHETGANSDPEIATLSSKSRRLFDTSLFVAVVEEDEEEGRDAASSAALTARARRQSV